MDTTPAEKLDALTGLRFIAAAMIVAHHARIFGIPVPSFAFDHGVSLFFVLSGFILCHVYPNLDDWKAARSFLALRLVRIWPAHMVTLILTVLLLIPITQPSSFIANLLMVHAWVPTTPYYFSFNAPSWSMSTEFFFYLAFPLLLWGGRGTFWWKWLLALGIVVLLCIVGKKFELSGYNSTNSVTLHGLLYINPLARLLEFVTGMVAYAVFAWLRPQIGNIGVPRASVLEVAVFGLAAYCIAYHPIAHVGMPYLKFMGVQEWFAHSGNFLTFPFLIIVLALGSGALSRLLSTRVAILLGEISFAIYLTHQLVFRLYRVHWLPSGDEPDYLGLVICLWITLTLSLLIWMSVEVPCRKWVRAWLKSEISPRAIASSAAIGVHSVTAKANLDAPR